MLDSSTTTVPRPRRSPRRRSTSCHASSLCLLFRYPRESPPPPPAAAAVFNNIPVSTRPEHECTIRCHNFVIKPRSHRQQCCSNSVGRMLLLQVEHIILSAESIVASPKCAVTVTDVQRVVWLIYFLPGLMYTRPSSRRALLRWADRRGSWCPATPLCTAAAVRVAINFRSTQLLS